MNCKWCTGELEVKCLDSCKDCRTLQGSLNEIEFETLVLKIGSTLLIRQVNLWTKNVKEND